MLVEKGIGGRTVEELNSRMGADEFTYWLAYFKIKAQEQEKEARKARRDTPSTDDED